MPSDSEVVSTRVPKDVKRRLQREADRRGVKLAEVVRERVTQPAPKLEPPA